MALGLLVAVFAGCSLCSNSSAPAIKKHPTDPKAVCMDIAPVICKKVSDCENIPVSACVDNWTDMCAMTTQIRNIDDLYNKCIPFFTKLTCEDYGTVKMPDFCANQFSSKPVK
jgi:hypothetical protein